MQLNYLNLIDEILNGQNKYFITDNEDGTKNIALANEVIQEGSNIKKANLINTDFALGYQELESETVWNQLNVYDQFYNILRTDEFFSEKWIRHSMVNIIV